MKMTTRPLVTLVAAALVGGLLAGCGGASAISIGAVFPLKGTLAPDGRQEALGVHIAEEMVNAQGGVHGHPVQIMEKDLDSTSQAASVVRSLADAGVPAVIGAYSSDLSMAASSAASNQGLVYWEAGAEANEITARGLPLVFRVGATGGDLGANTARFITTQLLPLMQASPQQLRVSLVTADDDYATSVSDAASAVLTAAGLDVVSNSLYNPYFPNWSSVISQLRSAQPDILVLSSHIPDGISFRKAFLASGLHVDAFLGSTMAQCLPNFGDALGAEAIGVFASDRPEGGFNPGALSPTALAVYDRFASLWKEQVGGVPTEEGLAGFTAAWALFADVLPNAQSLTPSGIAAAARATHLPEGSLPNGAGIDFSTSPGSIGQNLRAAAVIWQWQAVRHSVVVWPPAWATGSPIMVPVIH